jgi:hypothetical protein
MMRNDSELTNCDVILEKEHIRKQPKNMKLGIHQILGFSGPKVLKPLVPASPRPSS